MHRRNNPKPPKTAPTKSKPVKKAETKAKNTRIPK